MHLQWLEAGAIGTNAIVGGGVPLAAGSALGHRLAGTDAVAVTYFGDGAMNIGSTLETLNLAGAWSLPLCLFVENNRYAVSTNVAEVTGRAAAVRTWAGLRHPLLEGRRHGPAGRPPRDAGGAPASAGGQRARLIEADVYRYFHQNGPFPGSAFRYRSKEEEAEWRGRDPVDATAGHLVRRGILTPEQVDGRRARAKALMAEIGEVVLEPLPGGKPGERRIRPEEWPDPGVRRRRRPGRPERAGRDHFHRRRRPRGRARRT